MSTPVNADTQVPNGSNEQTQQIDYEKRYKDTQGAYTKSQQELKALKAKYEILEELTTPTIQLDEQTQKELNDLKFSDPDMWRRRINGLEADAKKAHREKLTQAEQLVAQQTELERRQVLLDEYNRSHPNLALNDDVIKYDVPPRITRKLENGEITFEEFLVEVSSYLQAPKAVGTGNTVLNQPNLSNVGGGENPSEAATKQDMVANYKKIVY